MFEQFLAFLRDIAGEQSGGKGPSPDSPAVAAAALLFHVMDADGVRADAERETLEREIASEFHSDGEALAAILSAGEAAEREAVDLYAFTSVLKRSLDHEARVAFIGMMWEIVYADGVRTEVEDNIVWRVAELIGVDSAERVRMRQEVAGRRKTDEGGNGD
ncbi:MAG: TerB family tellurite resistance protein [Mesorhizobium sp.]